MSAPGPISGGVVDGLHESEVQHLHEVALLAVAAEKDVRRLDVAVHEPAGLRLRERVTDLAEEVDDALGGDGPEAAHERIGVQPVEQLHRVVEGAVVGDPEVEEVDGVRRAEARDGLRFTLESPHGLARDPDAAVAGDRRTNQLDRRRPRQHPMPGAPDFSHATFTQPFLQAVASELARRGHFAAEPVDDPRAHDANPTASVEAKIA